MLALREHVERRELDLVRLGLLPEHDEQVARAGEAVDPDSRRELALGLLHVEVARADDDVDARDRLGPYASAATACAPPIR